MSLQTRGHLLLTPFAIYVSILTKTVDTRHRRCLNICIDCYTNRDGAGNRYVPPVVTCREQPHPNCRIAKEFHHEAHDSRRYRRARAGWPRLLVCRVDHTNVGTGRIVTGQAVCGIRRSTDGLHVCEDAQRLEVRWRDHEGTG